LNPQLVIIPTYNEIENISQIIQAVMDLPIPFDLLIVDDGSPDGTASVVKETIPRFENRLFLMERKGKLGLGTAYLSGFAWALERDYSFICEMDADFSHNPMDLERLVVACQEKNTGVVVGSRYIKGGQLVNWPLNRILISRGASIYVRCITWMPVADATAGFVCYSRSFLEQLDFSKISFVGYAFQIEMKFAAWQLGFKIKEIPITFKDRTEGASKMSTAIFSEAFWGVWKMRWNAFFNSYRK
jgi:dolichol-phosphate mannosyltransferase